VRIEAEDPAVVRPHVGVRGEGDVDAPVGQEEVGALQRPEGVERHPAVDAAVAGAVDDRPADVGERAAPRHGDGVAEDDGTAKLLGPAGQVQGVQAEDVVVVGADQLARLGDDEQGAGGRVDDRRGGDADLRLNGVGVADVAVRYRDDVGGGVD